MRTRFARWALLLVLVAPAAAPAAEADPAPALAPGPFDPLVVTKRPLLLGHLSLGKYRDSLSPVAFEYVAREFHIWNEGSYYLQHVTEFSFCFDDHDYFSHPVGAVTFDKDSKIDDVTHGMRTTEQKYGNWALHLAQGWDEAYCLVSPRRLVVGRKDDVTAYLDRLDAKKPNPLPDEWQAVLKTIDQGKWFWAAWVPPEEMRRQLSHFLDHNQPDKPLAKLEAVTLEIDLRHLNVTTYFGERDAARQFHRRMLPEIERAREQRRQAGLDLLARAATRPLETLNLQCRGRSVRFDVDLPGVSDLAVVWLESRLRTARR